MPLTPPRFAFLLEPPWRWLMPLLAGLLIFCAAGGFAYHLRNQARLEAQIAFSLDAALITVEIRDRLHQHAQLLQALRAFMSGFADPGPDDWRHFCDALDPRNQLPGLQAFGYMPAVPPSRLAAFEAAAQKRLHRPNYRVFPPAGMETRFPVLYVAPEDNNQAGIGYDLATEPVRREAMEQARDTGAVAMSRGLQLVLDRYDSKRPGFLLFLPIYDRRLPHRTVEERRAALTGYVFAAYRMSDFVRTLNYGRNPGLALRLFDDPSEAQRAAGLPAPLLYDSHPELGAGPDSALREEREINFAGRIWTLQIVDLHPPTLFSPKDPASITLASGVILASLTSLILWLIAAQGQRALDLAHSMTQKLDRSERIFRLAAEGANDGLWYRDFRRDKWYFSDRALALLGQADKAPEHTTGDTLLAAMHPDDALLHRRALDAHLRSRAPYVIEVRLRRPGDETSPWRWFQIKGQATWDAFDQPQLMAGSLSDIHARKEGELELRRHRDKLQELVRERTHRLEQALDEARAAGRAKSEFLANMSHELRTPLHAMLGFAALGMEKSGAENRLQRYFTRIHESAARLLALVDDLLDLAKLEARKMIVHPQRQDVLPILEQVQGELDPLLAAGRIDVVVACADCDTTALVDAPRFAQVLRNLLSNAIRFSPAGGSIRIEFSPSRLPRGRRASDHGTVAALALRIIDQGPGIPTDELESIFDKFVQSTRTRTGAGGTGLGLAICLEIMNAHRGRIYAENAPTGGACLVVILPAEDPFTPVQESSA